MGVHNEGCFIAVLGLWLDIRTRSSDQLQRFHSCCPLVCFFRIGELFFVFPFQVVIVSDFLCSMLG